MSHSSTGKTSEAFAEKEKIGKFSIYTTIYPASVDVSDSLIAITWTLKCRHDYFQGSILSLIFTCLCIAKQFTSNMFFTGAHNSLAPVLLCSVIQKSHNQQFLDSLWRRASVRIASFSISVRWSIYIINSVDKPNFRVSLLLRRSTTVSTETNPLNPLSPKSDQHPISSCNINTT